MILINYKKKTYIYLNFLITKLLAELLLHYLISNVKIFEKLVNINLQKYIWKKNTKIILEGKYHAKPRLFVVRLKWTNNNKKKVPKQRY